MALAAEEAKWRFAHLMDYYLTLVKCSPSCLHVGYDLHKRKQTATSPKVELNLSLT